MEAIIMNLQTMLNLNVVSFYTCIKVLQTMKYPYTFNNSPGSPDKDTPLTGSCYSISVHGCHPHNTAHTNILMMSLHATCRVSPNWPQSHPLPVTNCPIAFPGN